MQVRSMLAGPPPLFVAAPGRVYRQETPDATHAPVFTQIEGLAIDADLTLADLRGTLSAVARATLGEDIGLRFVPDHFPFTEPSCQLIAVRDGQELELLGAGMVHPNVLRAVGYDPEQVGGFAFGMGVERMAMLRHGIADLRLFAENDLRFLASF
jgi:phenylalanyl-tRNA synthetase alpha chain